MVVGIAMRRDYHPERAVKEAMQTPQVNDSPALFHEVALRLENLGGSMKCFSDSNLWTHAHSIDGPT